MKFGAFYFFGATLSSVAYAANHARHLKGQVCTEPTESDFLVPAFDVREEIPILHQLHIGIFEATIPSLNEYETTISVRLANFVDMAIWNCVASFHKYYQSSLLQVGTTSESVKTFVGGAELPLIRSMNKETHTSSSRIMCAMYANANLRSTMFGATPSAHESFMAGLPAAVLNLTTSDLDIPVALREACPSVTDSACLRDYAACHGYTPKVMGSIVAYQIAHFSLNDGWNANGVLTENGRACK